MTFRLKLLLSMVLLVVGIMAITLFITENQVRLSYERHFQQSFRFQVDYFLQERESRMDPIKERASSSAAGMRLFAALENAIQGHAEDIDDLYQNGLDQLSDLVPASGSAPTNEASGFFFFLNDKGRLL